ncbi:hypothetical protein ACH5RR_026306 [Cinchona calisaya]|uniref:Uncharacterized protein n=1 Tax=Cinchona calisaya TaxID=153742 RepID=A0ABD2Z3B5_9GENT
MQEKGTGIRWEKNGLYFTTDRAMEGFCLGSSMQHIGRGLGASIAYFNDNEYNPSQNTRTMLAMEGSRRINSANSGDFYKECLNDVSRLLIIRIEEIEKCESEAISRPQAPIVVEKDVGPYSLDNAAASLNALDEFPCPNNKVEHEKFVNSIGYRRMFIQ